MLTWLDHRLFLAINHGLADPLLDAFMVTLTNLHNEPRFRWALVPLVLGYWLYAYRMKAVRVIVAVAVTIAITDQVSYRIFKNITDRPRPHHVESLNAIVRVPYPPKSSSLPSNHAVNAFAAATIVAFFAPGGALYAFLIALAVAFSRVYVGVHFVSDVVVGAVLGIVMAYLVRGLILRRFAWFQLIER